MSNKAYYLKILFLSMILVMVGMVLLSSSFVNAQDQITNVTVLDSQVNANPARLNSTATLKQNSGSTSASVQYSCFDSGLKAEWQIIPSTISGQCAVTDSLGNVTFVPPTLTDFELDPLPCDLSTRSPSEQAKFYCTYAVSPDPSSITGDTGDDMFRIGPNAKGFFEFIPTDQLLYIERSTTGPNAPRTIVLPSGPAGTYSDFLGFVNNAPVGLIQIENACAPFSASVCQNADPGNTILACGTASGGSYSAIADISSANLCDNGTLIGNISLDTSTESFSWTCQASSGNETQNCSAIYTPPIEDATCGAADSETYSDVSEIQISALCSNNDIASTVTLDVTANIYNWTCSNDSSTQNCSANRSSLNPSGCAATTDLYGVRKADILASNYSCDRIRSIYEKCGIAIPATGPGQFDCDPAPVSLEYFYGIGSITGATDVTYYTCNANSTVSSGNESCTEPSATVPEYCNAAAHGKILNQPLSTMSDEQLCNSAAMSGNLKALFKYYDQNTRSSHWVCGPDITNPYVGKYAKEVHRCQSTPDPVNNCGNAFKREFTQASRVTQAGLCASGAIVQESMRLANGVYSWTCKTTATSEVNQCVAYNTNPEVSAGLTKNPNRYCGTANDQFFDRTADLLNAELCRGDAEIFILEEFEAIPGITVYITDANGLTNETGSALNGTTTPPRITTHNDRKTHSWRCKSDPAATQGLSYCDAYIR